MLIHVELMARVAKLVAPFLTLGGQGLVVNSEFLWQRGRSQMMEFLQAATCADQLEVLWKRMDDDVDEEVDPSGMVLEIPGQQDAVLEQGINESPIPIEDAGSETMGDTGSDGKAPEVSPEEETSSGSSRLAGARMFLWSVYSRVASNWDFSMQDRTTGGSLTVRRGILVKDRTMVMIFPLRGTYPGSLKITSTKWCQKRWKGLQIWMG